MRQRAAKGEHEATKASNLGSHEARKSIVKDCKQRIMDKREHQACTSKCPQWKQDKTGIEIAWGFRTRGCSASEWYLDRQNDDEGRGKRTMGIDTWQRQWQKRHKMRV